MGGGDYYEKRCMTKRTRRDESYGPARRGGSRLPRRDRSTRNRETYRQVEHTGTGWQKTTDRTEIRQLRRRIRGGRYALDRHTEQTNPISTIRLWQKHAALKSTRSCVGTAMSCLMAGGGRKDILHRAMRERLYATKSGGRTIMYCRSASVLSTCT